MHVDIVVPVPGDMPLKERINFVADTLKHKAEKQGCPLNLPVKKGQPYFCARLMWFNPKTRRFMYRIRKVEAIWD